MLKSIVVLSFLVVFSSLQAEDFEFYEKKIRPVLVEHCYRCHSNETGKSRGGLVVDSIESMRLGGESGPAVVPGNHRDSVLWRAMNWMDDMEMPRDEKLSAEILKDFENWIDQGAHAPSSLGVVAVQGKVSDEDIEEAKAHHWAYQSVESPAIPKIEETSWAKTKVDHFILAPLEAEAIPVNKDADALSILRRMAFDLMGLPPSLEEMASFEKAYKKNPDLAIENQAKQYLDRPQFGERWGRHWLDLTRFAESTGKELNAAFPHAWRYRNYVIDSFNEDKPYDQFLKEQVAGDLLPAKSDEKWAENLVATGFLAIGPKALPENNPRQFRADLIDDQIDAVTRVMLGLTVACARCHDHKFDAIRQSDYYAMAGFFESTETYYGTGKSFQNRNPSNLMTLPVKDSNEIVMDAAQRKEKEDELKNILASQRQARMQSAMMRNNNNGEVKQSDIQKMLRARNQADLRFQQIRDELDAVDDKGYARSLCMGVQDSRSPKNATIFIRGEVDAPSDTVQRAFLPLLDHQTAPRQFKGSGRRELADWIAARDNPLTSRVMVNRIWQNLMGKALVASGDNFGANGEKPSHPELLDYLASQFMAKDWSVKAVVLEIVKSRVYRLSSVINKKAQAADPLNRQFWRANFRRQSAESLRDSILWASGTLDLTRPEASAVSMMGQVAFGRLYKSESLDRPVNYRSVYLPIIRDGLPRFLAVFDGAEPNMIISNREETNTPIQALYLMNNSLVLRESVAMAKRLMKESSLASEQVRLAFKLIYSRDATSSELRATESYLRKLQLSSKAKASKEEKLEVALSTVCQSLFASADFRYIN